jgi:hypothetical protein
MTPLFSERRETIQWTDIKTLPKNYPEGLLVRYESDTGDIIEINTIWPCHSQGRVWYVDTDLKPVGSYRDILKRFQYWAYAPRKKLGEK